MLSSLRRCFSQARAARSFSGLKHGFSAVELEEAIGAFPAVKLRGLPYSASLDDITEFLNGLHTLDVVVPSDNVNGTAGVLFSTLEDANSALQRDKDNMGSRYIDVIPIPRVEYYLMAMDAIAREAGADGQRGEPNMQGADEGSVVKMTGLPFQASFNDIKKFFSGFNLESDNIIIEARNDGRPSGNAFVRFSSPEEAIAALDYDKKYMGKRYVNLQVTKTSYAENCIPLR